MERRLFLDVVIGQSSAILQLLAGEYQALLVWWDAFLVLDLGLDIVDGIGRFDLERNRLAREAMRIASTSGLIGQRVKRRRSTIGSQTAR